MFENTEVVGPERSFAAKVRELAPRVHDHFSMGFEESRGAMAMAQANLEGTARCYQAIVNSFRLMRGQIIEAPARPTYGEKK